jgi:hypothetical protein
MAGPRLPGRDLADLDRERHELLGNSNARERQRQLDALIDARTTALGAWALRYPQPEQTELLGVPPREPERRAEWALAAGTIAAYHERYGVAYKPELTPERADQHFEHYEVTRAVDNAIERLDCSRPLEQEQDLGLGL